MYERSEPLQLLFCIYTLFLQRRAWRPSCTVLSSMQIGVHLEPLDHCLCTRQAACSKAQPPVQFTNRPRLEHVIDHIPTCVPLKTLFLLENLCPFLVLARKLVSLPGATVTLTQMLMSCV